MNADGCLLEDEKEEKFLVWIKKSNHFGRYFAVFFRRSGFCFAGYVMVFFPSIYSYNVHALLLRSRYSLERKSVDMHP